MLLGLDSNKVRNESGNEQKKFSNLNSPKKIQKTLSYRIADKNLEEEIGLRQLILVP
jgi:hypothetical protein